jgi:hypothetical protein
MGWVCSTNGRANEQVHAVGGKARGKEAAQKM